MEQYKLQAIDLTKIYDGGSKGAVTAIDHVNLEVEAGSYVALVGSSGGGKTTLCSLIPRFYDVTSGSVRIDGYDVRDVTLKSLRENIGIVQQDVYLFSGSVAAEEDVEKPNNATFAIFRINGRGFKRVVKNKISAYPSIKNINNVKTVVIT